MRLNNHPNIGTAALLKRNAFFLSLERMSAEAWFMGIVRPPPSISKICLSINWSLLPDIAAICSFFAQE